MLIEQETAEKFKQDSAQLFQDDWDETNPFAEQIDFKLDYEKYFILEKQGRLLIVTARDEGKLVGYIGFIASSSLHHKETVARSAGLFVAKTHRGGMLGYKLIKRAIELQKGTTVKKIRISFGPFKDISKMLKRIGMTHAETVYEMVIN